MADNTIANKKTTANSKQTRSKKRRFGGQHDGTRKKRKFNFDVDLTKKRNIILCSCQRFKEKACGRDLKLMFTEYIEELLKENNEKENNENNTNKPQHNDNDNQDDDLKVKSKEVTDTKQNNDNEDDDLKMKNNKNDSNNNENDKNENENENKNENNTTNNNKNENKPEISIADAINKELSNLENNSLCEWIQGPDGLVIIDILCKDIAASKLLEFIFNKSYPLRPNLSPFVYKLYPLDITTFSRSDEIIKIAQKVIENINWNKINKSDTYAINYKNRANKQLDRKTLVESIASLVPNEFKVDLSNPQIVILLQTFGRTAGISVITNGQFHKHKEYNLGNFQS